LEFFKILIQPNFLWRKFRRY